MTLSSSSHSLVWTADLFDQFTAMVWAKDEKGSEQNHLICKFRNDCDLGARSGTHVSSQHKLKLLQKDGGQIASSSTSKSFTSIFFQTQKTKLQW